MPKDLRNLLFFSIIPPISEKPPRTAMAFLVSCQNHYQQFYATRNHWNYHKT